MVQSPSFLLTVVAFVLMLGPLIVLHELGHYFAGRLFGVRAEAFSVGFGKELWHRIDKRGTRWRLAAFPLGGYVMFAGDADPSSKPGTTEGKSPEALKGTMAGAALWQRALIVLAGPMANLLTAVLIFTAWGMIYGIAYTPPVVGDYSKDSPAQAAGIQKGDRIVAIDGARIDDFSDIAPRVGLYPGRQVTVAVDRAGRQLEIPVTIRMDTEKDQFGNTLSRGLLGISAVKSEFRRLGPLDALGKGVTATYETMRMMAIGLKQIIVGTFSVKELGGPLKMAKLSGERLSLGWLAFVDFAALISINLAFINLLPIPTLDGGHLAIYAAEAIRRKPLDIRSQEWAFRIGMGFVLAFALFVTANDLAGMIL